MASCSYHIFNILFVKTTYLNKVNIIDIININGAILIDPYIHVFILYVADWAL